MPELICLLYDGYKNKSDRDTERQLVGSDEIQQSSAFRLLDFIH